jgi:hypothetical protein
MCGVRCCDRSGSAVDADAVAAVHAGAQATLCVDGVRFTEDRVGISSAVDGELDLHREGVASLAGLRADVVTAIPPVVVRGVARGARRLWSKHPWVMGEDELAELEFDDANEQTSHCVFIGGARFVFHPYFQDMCFTSSGDPLSDRRNDCDPTWIVEVLSCVDEADSLGIDPVAGAGCRRFSFHVDLERHRGELELPSYVGTLGAPHLVGEVWIDDDNLVRRVERERVHRRRRRYPGRAGFQQPRTATALCDFGIDVCIQTPEVKRSDASIFGATRSTAAILWRRRRDYKRAHDGQGEHSSAPHPAPPLG